MRFGKFAFIFSALMMTMAAQAQVPMPSNVMPNLLPQLGGYDPVSIALKKKRQEPGTPLDFSTPEDAPVVQTDFTYRYDRARTQRNLRNFVDRSPGAEAKAELRQMLSAQPELIQQIRTGMNSYGFDPDNAADAYAMWWMNAWMAANKQDADPSRSMIESVKQQVRNAFAATPAFADTTDAQRQEYAEALMLQASMLSTAFNQYKNDPRMLDQLATATRQGAKASGLDLSLMTLTQNGFVPR